MNPINEVSNAGDDPRRFDLLVDGELSETERRALLSGLDHEAEGWRRCAMAFLEAQCWKNDFGAMVRPAVECRSQRQSAAPSPWRHRLSTTLAMAASFLVALMLGTRLRDGWLGGNHPAAGLRIDSVATTRDGVKSAAPSQSPVGLGVQPAGGSSDPWQLVTLTTPKGPGGARETIRLPAIQRDRLDPEWMEDSPGAIPPEVLQAFERTGHQVQQHRELLPLEMQDGRRLVVPVDRVEVHFVGRPAL